VEEPYVEAMMRAALAEAQAAREAREHPIAAVVALHPDPAVQSAQIVERIPYVAAHIETYRGGVLQHESRALFERYAPRMLDWLDDRVVRHRQPPD